MDTTQQTILIVDDNLEGLKPLWLFLKEQGFRIAVARSGEEALKRAEHIHPDVILLDVLMPGIDGFETCQRLKEQDTTRDILIIFLTALTEAIDKITGFEVGGTDYLTKPPQHEEVLVRINAHLKIRSLQQQLRNENERFRSLAEATLEGIVIYDPDQIVEANHIIVELFGYPYEKLMDKHFSDLLAPDSRDIVARHFRTGTEPPYEVEGMTRKGNRFPVEIQVRPISWQGRETHVAAIRDVTWRKTIEEEKTHLQQEKEHLQQENITLRSGIAERYKFGDIIGKSPAMQKMYEQIVSAAASETNVVICGESGTGKDLVARTIYQMSARKDQEFVIVNCGAVTESIFEREFFGHRKGAFTGADRNQPGYFDHAHQGTLFLNEVGELTPALQVNLLQVIETGEYIPLGETHKQKADVRIIAATNRNLHDMVRQGDMREDFFYRICVIEIMVPPLRERKEDILLLLDHFLQRYDVDTASSPIPAKIRDALCAYDWPGNVRELQNELQHYLATGRLKFTGNLSPEPAESQRAILSVEGMTFKEATEAFEKDLLTGALAQNNWHQGNTAKMLHISPKSLYNKMVRYNLKKTSRE